MKSWLICVLIILLFSACGSGSRQTSYDGPSQPPNGGGGDSCARNSTSLTDAGFNNDTELAAYLTANNITRVNNIIDIYVIPSVIDFKKIPAAMLTHLISEGNSFHLIEGNNVVADADFPDPMGSTADGRLYTGVFGAHINNDSYMVASKIFSGSTLTSLVLHQLGHAISQRMSGTISEGADWQNIFNTQGELLFPVLNITCGGDYCSSNAEEAFAEAFAIYYNCEASRNLLSDKAAILTFFEALEASY